MRRTDRRHFIFLQGVASPFFRHLAEAVRETGALVHRVNFCGGDWLYSDHRNDWDFKGRADDFPTWFAAKMSQHKVTDLVLFGDFRPAHVAAIELAREQDIEVHVFEEGYLRPHWITLDQGGVNANSSLPKTAEDVMKRPLPEELPVPDNAHYRLKVRALHDLLYHLGSYSQFWRFPHYRTHRNRTPAQEYRGWIQRFPQLPFHARRCRKAIDELINSKASYYVHPLQLSADTQIRIHSPFDDVQHALKSVLASFAKNAPQGSKIVIKNHPLDTGLDKHQQRIRKYARQFGIAERVIYLETGNLDKLLRHARGAVVVNSTVGMTALGIGCPVKALGQAIYNFSGLTFQGGLDAFWNEGQPCDVPLFEHFRKLVIVETQLNGDLYGKKGIDMAVAASLQRLQLSAISLEMTDQQLYGPGSRQGSAAVISDDG